MQLKAGSLEVTTVEEIHVLPVLELDFDRVQNL